MSVCAKAVVTVGIPSTLIGPGSPPIFASNGNADGDVAISGLGVAAAIGADAS